MRKKYTKQKSPTVYIMLFLLVLAFSAWFFAPNYLPYVAKFLVYEKPIDHAQVGVVLSGDNGLRVDKAVALYKAKKVDILLMSGGPTFRTSMAKEMKDYAISLGVPKNKIWMEAQSESTLDNARFSLNVLKEHHVKSALIITSKYHSRRSFSCFKRIFDQSGIDLGIAGADDNIKIDQWWKHGESKELVVIEWIKTVVYWTK